MFFAARRKRVVEDADPYKVLLKVIVSAFSFISHLLFSYIFMKRKKEKSYDN